MAVVRDEIQLHLEGGDRGSVESALQQGELGANVGAELEGIYKDKTSGEFLHFLTEERLIAQSDEIQALIGGPFMPRQGDLSGTGKRTVVVGATGSLEILDDGLIYADDYNGGALTSATINAALTALGASKRRLVLKAGNWTINADVVVPQNIVLILEVGAVLVQTSSFTVTVNGPLIAGQYQIFSGTGSAFIIANHGRIPAQWFGAKGDGITNDTTAVQATIDCAYASNGIAYFPTGTYLVTAISRAWTTTNYLRIQGEGIAGTTIRKTGATTTPILDLYSSDSPGVPYLENFFEMADIKLLGNANAHHGLSLTRMALCKFERVNIVDCNYGVNNVGSLINNWNACRFVANNRGFVASKATGTTTVYSNMNNFYGCRFKGNYQLGLDYGGGNNGLFVGCEFDANGTNSDITTGAVMIRATTDDEFGFGVMNFDSCWMEGNKGRTFQAEVGGGAFIRVQNTELVGNETGGSARAMYIDGARGVYLENVCAGGPSDVVEITANVGKTDIRNSTISTLTDNCENKNHFNVNDSVGLARGFSTDLFVSRLAKLRIGVTNTYGQEHQLYNDGSNRLNIETYAGADVRVPSNVQFADGAYNSGHPKFGNFHLWKDGNNDLRMKNGTPGSAYDGWPMFHIRNEKITAIMANDANGQVVIGTKPASANFAYTAKDDTAQSFTTAAMLPKNIPVPNSTFTIGGVTYTVLKWDDQKVYVYEATSGAAASGTLTGVTTIPVFMRILSTGKIEMLGAASGDFNLKLNAPTGSYPILEFRENDDSATSWQQYKDPTTDELIFWGGAEILKIVRGAAFPTIKLGATLIQTGTGTPEGALTAPVGSMFLRTNGGAATTLYIKESGAGNTGWVAK